MAQTIDNKIGNKESKRKSVKRVLDSVKYMDKSREGQRITEGFHLRQQAQPGSQIGSDYYE